MTLALHGLPPVTLGAEATGRLSEGEDWPGTRLPRDGLLANKLSFRPSGPRRSAAARPPSSLPGACLPWPVCAPSSRPEPQSAGLLQPQPGRRPCTLPLQTGPPYKGAFALVSERPQVCCFPQSRSLKQSLCQEHILGGRGCSPPPINTLILEFLSPHPLQCG